MLTESCLRRLHRRRGFTILELFVTLGIIVVLLSLMLPAINMAHQSAYRTRCQNNLKQIGLALLHYHEVFETFPPGYIARDVAPDAPSSAESGSGYAWGSMLLPYLDQGALAGLIDWNLDATDPTNLSVMATVLPGWQCDADPASTTFDVTAGLGVYILGTSSYIGMYGVGDLTTSPGKPEGAGVFYRNSYTPAWGITDGLSNTILVSERSAFQDFTPGQQPVAAHGTWFAAIPGVTRPAGTRAGVPANVGSASLVLGTVGWNTPENVTLRPNHTNHVAAFSSPHAGGLHALLGDSSVRWVSDQIDDLTLRHLAQQRDGQPLGDF